MFHLVRAEQRIEEIPHYKMFSSTLFLFPLPLLHNGFKHLTRHSITPIFIPCSLLIASTESADWSLYTSQNKITIDYYEISKEMRPWSGFTKSDRPGIWFLLLHYSQQWIVKPQQVMRITKYRGRQRDCSKPHRHSSEISEVHLVQVIRFPKQLVQCQHWVSPAFPIVHYICCDSVTSMKHRSFKSLLLKLCYPTHDTSSTLYSYPSFIYFQLQNVSAQQMPTAVIDLHRPHCLALSEPCTSWVHTCVSGKNG